MSPRESPQVAAVDASASLLRRLGAAIYELLLLTALAFITQLELLPLASPGHTGAASALSVPPVAVRTFLFCVQFAVFALYLCWFWTRGRRTLAQKTWGLRLTTNTGGSLHRKRALLRYLALWVGPALALVAWMPLAAIGHGGYAALLLAFNFLWAFGDRRRVFLHDRIAGTRVIDSR
ncbi:MAG: RDD family protein [Casimicrobiaceae bacterium]